MLGEGPLPEPIVVQFAALSALVEGLESGLARIAEQLEQLRADLLPLLDSWEGKAREAYLARQKEWNQAMDDLHASLKYLHHVASTGHANYATADAAVLRGWGAA